MDERRYKLLMKTAILLSICWVGWTIFDTRRGPVTSGDLALEAGIRYLQDHRYQDALATFATAAEQDPENLGALRGKAQALAHIAAAEHTQAKMHRRSGSEHRATALELSAQLHDREALLTYNEAIDRQQQRTGDNLQQKILGISYANRGILKDRMGDYIGALADYDRAIDLEPEVKTGPSLLTRFFRNQSDRPPTIADRAEYLRHQLTLPESKQVLRIPEEDRKQRAYRMD